MSAQLTEGDAAPDFTATALGGAYGRGETVSLQDFAGRHLILYFYPKDDTPGCTVQACGIRDRWPDFSARDASLFGVSVDSLSSHQAFIDKYGLPFPLLSDESGKIVRDYGVAVERERDGKMTLGAERSTFVIGTSGKIEAIFRKVRPEEHADQVLAALNR